MATVRARIRWATRFRLLRILQRVDVIHPAINVVKSADKTVVLPGGLVQYTFVVTNPGDDPLSTVTVLDPVCSAPPVFQGNDANNNGKLDPGEVWTYTCSANLNATTVNTVTVSGTPSLGAPVTDTDSKTVTVVNPAINVVKAADKTYVLPGGQVVYTYTVTNPGNTPLADVNVVDNRCSPVGYVSGDTNSNGLLDVSETWIYNCTTNLAADTTNTVTASGQPSDNQGVPLPGIPLVRDTDTKSVDVVDPGIQVVKSASATTVRPGNPVTYSYAVTNTGDVPLFLSKNPNTSVLDNKCSPVNFTGGDTNNNGLLDLTETWTFACTTNLALDTTNTVTATGQPATAPNAPLPGIGPVSDQDTEFVDVINPSIDGR